MAGVQKDNNEMLKTDTDQSHWTQFELDLIKCIKDEYPIIYTKIGNFNRFQRAAKVRMAWKQISNKFKEIPMAQIRRKWKSLLDNYLKIKIYAESISESGSSSPNKFTDGTLSFLEDVLIDYRTDNVTHAEDSSDNESYEVNIKDSLHEEVDLVDDDTIKSETLDEEIVDSFEAPNDSRTEKNKKSWTEEELMNATRLTKEMIDRLIEIKTKRYYNAPAGKG